MTSTTVWDPINPSPPVTNNVLIVDINWKKFMFIINNMIKYSSDKT